MLHLVPILPPGSTWKPKPVLLDGPVGEDSGTRARVSNRTFPRDVRNSQPTIAEKPTDFRNIVEKFKNALGGHSAPAFSKGKRFILPQEKPGGLEVVVGDLGEKEVGGLKRGSESVGREGSVVREEVIRRRAGGSSLKMKAIIEESVGGAQEVSNERDADDKEKGVGVVKREKLRETRSLSGSRRTSGTLQTKSSWICYLDGPEESKVMCMHMHAGMINYSYCVLQTGFSIKSLKQTWEHVFLGKISSKQ